jgi:hypothetical protein
LNPDLSRKKSSKKILIIRRDFSNLSLGFYKFEEILKSILNLSSKERLTLEVFKVGFKNINNYSHFSFKIKNSYKSLKILEK